MVLAHRPRLFFIWLTVFAYHFLFLSSMIPSGRTNPKKLFYFYFTSFPCYLISLYFLLIYSKSLMPPFSLISVPFFPESEWSQAHSHLLYNDLSFPWGESFNHPPFVYRDEHVLGLCFSIFPMFFPEEGFLGLWLRVSCGERQTFRSQELVLQDVESGSPICSLSTFGPSGLSEPVSSSNYWAS